MMVYKELMDKEDQVEIKVSKENKGPKTPKPQNPWGISSERALCGGQGIIIFICLRFERRRSTSSFTSTSRRAVGACSQPGY